MTETKALAILKKYTTKPNLIKHALAVAATMRHFAKLEGEDQEYWAVVGLLHDIDYEQFESEHCHKCVELLQNEGFDDKFIHAIQSHGYEICTDICPNCYMEEVLCAIDQITGFLIACALIRPDKKLANVEMSSILKKWKTPSFAAGTERQRIEGTCARMGRTLEYMLEQTLVALNDISDKLGL
ncbi:MAG: HDIG domain-containing protein [Firmicutes bacterium]|nr:HDIG domain-containing protein [Bacillota bacterium]